MASLDLIIFSVVAVAGVAFLLWVLYHLILESRQTRRRRRHSFSHLSSLAGCNGMLPLNATLCCRWRHSDALLGEAEALGRKNG